MKTIIIYSSKYGITKKYAYEIQARLNCDISVDTVFDVNDFLEYDIIIYGGRLTMGKIQGFKLIYDNFELIKNKKIYLFFVGIYSEFNTISEIIDNNLDSEMKKVIDFSYFKGAYDYNRLSTLHKIVMQVCIRLAIKHYKQHPSENLEEEITRMKDKADLTNETYVEEFVNKIHN